MTTSSVAALPARSPSPLKQVSTRSAPCMRRGQRVGNGQPKIVVAVGGDTHTGELAAHLLHQLAELPGQGEANGIAERHEAHAFPHDCFDHLEDEIVLGAGGVLEREVHVRRVLPAARYARARQFQHLRARFIQFDLTVQRRGADEGMDRALRRVFDRLPRPVDVFGKAAGRWSRSRRCAHCVR